MKTRCLETTGEDRKSRLHSPTRAMFRQLQDSERRPDRKVCCATADVKSCASCLPSFARLLDPFRRQLHLLPTQLASGCSVQGVDLSWLVRDKRSGADARCWFCGSLNDITMIVYVALYKKADARYVQRLTEPRGSEAWVTRGRINLAGRGRDRSAWRARRARSTRPTSRWS